MRQSRPESTGECSHAELHDLRECGGTFGRIFGMKALERTGLAAIDGLLRFGHHPRCSEPTNPRSDEDQEDSSNQTASKLSHSKQRRGRLGWPVVASAVTIDRSSDKNMKLQFADKEEKEQAAVF